MHSSSYYAASPPHVDIFQMFNKPFYFSTTYLSFIQLSQINAVLGLFSYIIWNGDLSILLLIELLYANSTYGKIISQSFGLSPTKHLSKFPKLRFTTSVCPSVCGWCDELNFKSVFNFFHNVHQKYPTNLVSRSDTILLGRPCSLTTSLKNKSAI